jgi:hypothetical protein
MQQSAVQAGATDVSVLVRAFDAATGLPVTTITHASAGLAIRTKRGATGALTTVTPASLATQETAHTDGGIIHLHAGTYRVDLPDAAVASGAPWVQVTLVDTADTVFTTAYLDISAGDPRAAGVTVGALRNDAINLIGNIVNGATQITLKDSTNTDVDITVTRAARQAIATTTIPTP